MAKPLLLLIIYGALWVTTSCVKSYVRYHHMDTDLPMEERVDSLISLMTLEEKVSQMMDNAPAIPRLGVPEYNWWNEALHGVARAGEATVFPQAIGLAAAFDEPLMRTIADIISTEARAKYHHAQKEKNYKRYFGLTFWSPNINIFRDPRWGRGQETYGEDPYWTGKLGLAFVEGIQGKHSKYLKAIATPKHFAVHNGPEAGRHSFNALAGDRDLWETYLPAFEKTVVQGKAYSVMCAYNAFRGEPCCSNKALLEDILRKRWGFQGYVVSDCGAIRDISEHHKTVANAQEASARSVRAGTDLNCGSHYKALLNAVKNGLLSEAELDISLRRLFLARFRLGMFDPDEKVSFSNIPFEMNVSLEHGQVALQAASKSIVLLKNSGGLLPLQAKKYRQIAVIGPNANYRDVLLGNYNGTPPYYITPLDGIQKLVGDHTRIVYAKGCGHVSKAIELEVIPEEVLSESGQQGLKAEFFSNTELKGDPDKIRQDETVNLNWAQGNPVPPLPIENISARWTGLLTPTVSGEYTLAVTGDDGYRLYLNGKLLIDQWHDQSTKTTTAKVLLEEGVSDSIRLEYYQGTGGASIKLRWIVPTKKDPMQEAVELAAESDLIVFVGGISPRLEGEQGEGATAEGFYEGDRTTIQLPSVQRELLMQIKETGTPIVGVFMSGSALALNWSNENLPALLQAWYPGQEGGTALAQILFGKQNPSGRLPITFYKSVKDLPPFEDYSMTNRTYRYFTGTPLYPFGYGLSYTSFKFQEFKTPDVLRVGSSCDLSVIVSNTGAMDGEEVIQVYVSHPNAPVPTPIHSLKAIRRVFLKKGFSKRIKLTLSPDDLAILDKDMNRRMIEGKIKLFIGGGQPGFAANSISRTLTVVP